MNLQLRGKAKPDKASDHPCLLLCTWVGLPASSRQSRHFFGRGSLPRDSNLLPVDIKINPQISLRSSFPFYSDPFLVFQFLWLFQVNDSNLKIQSHPLRKNMRCLSFWVWDTPAIVFTRSEIFMIYSPSQMNRLLTVCMFPVFIAHSSVDGHLDCSRSLDMGSRVGTSMNKQTSLW